MRRHVLYAEQERETSVGDHDAQTSVLALWLRQRQQRLHGDATLTRLLTLFWTLAKPTHATCLHRHDYVAFFQCVAKALVQSVGNDHAARVAARDWLYDCAAGGAKVSDPDELLMSLEQFKEALLQCADLMLPVESDAATVAGFFQELRDAITVQGDQHHHDNGEEADAVPRHAMRLQLRPLHYVAKIRGTFLQTMPPDADHLAQIRGLASPDMDSQSLKQLLLSYNPRKLSLSRSFSSLFTSDKPPPVTDPFVLPSLPEAAEAPPAVVSLLDASPLLPSAMLSRASDDGFDVETAVADAIETSPALRITVVGPPGAGKSRVATSLAKRLGLQYVSTATAIEDAVASKKTRMAARAEQRRVRAEARGAERLEKAEAEATPSDPDPQADSSEAAAFDIDADDADSEEPPPDAADLLFGDAELTALQRGEALADDKAVAVLVAFVQTLLLRGVGVVLDDVFPLEIEGQLTIDYVVALEMPREDARRHAMGFTVAPTSRRVYSAREREMLTECDAVLRDRGYMDAAGRVDLHGGGETLEGDGLDKRRTRVAEAVAVAVAALAKPATTGDDGEAEPDEPVAAEESSGDAETDDVAEEKTETAVVEESSPAQRNEIPPLGEETTVSLRELTSGAFDAQYRHYQVRADGLASAARTQVIPVIAAQAVSDIVDQCVVAITNNSLGICRSAASRVALPIPLPDDLLASANRADQLRWLLYSDWTDLLAESPAAPFAYGPLDPRGPRTLSRWRDCCIVSSSTSSSSPPAKGDPQWAAYFSGRVYLFASATAREAFTAAPLQYIRRRPPTQPFVRKLWILSSGPLDDETGCVLSSLVDGDHVSVTNVLASHHSIQQIMDLVEGKPMAPLSMSSIMADVLADKGTYVVSDLVVTKEVLETLRDRQCLPDAIVVLTVEEPDLLRVFRTPLERKMHELWADVTTRLGELLAEMQLTVPLLQSPLLADASEMKAALARLLSPLAPRVDTAEEGSMRDVSEADEEHTQVFGPLSDDQEAAEGDDATVMPPSLLDPVGYDATQRAWVTRRRRMGETAQFCAVTWATTRVLVPGQPLFVASFQQKLYAFAGADQLTAFARNPTRYVPSAARATRSVVPVIWLLGVRGTNAAALARGVAATLPGARVGVLDDAGVAQRVQRRLRAQLLLPVDKRTPVGEEYVDAFAQELHFMRASENWDVVLVTNLSPAGISVPDPLEGDVDSPAPIVPLPTPELLALFFQRVDLFPTTVLPLHATEEAIVQRQLTKWRETLPSRRPQRKPTLQVDDAEEAQEIDPAEQEAAESVHLREQFQADQEAQTLALETLRARGITVATALDMNATRRAVAKRLAESITTLLGQKYSLFEYCERVQAVDVSNWLHAGDAVVGKHAMQCPITGDVPSLSAGPALVYRRRLYFPQSPSALLQCELAPALSLTEASSQPPQCRVSCCVVGPPRVGKTRLAKQVARQSGLVYVSPRTAIDWVRQCLAPQSSLWSALQATPSSDWQKLPPALVHDAIHTRLCSSDCQRHGWVLDDYVTTSDQLVRCLNGTQRIHPGVVFALEGSVHRVWTSTDPTDRERLAEGFVVWHTHRLELVHTWTRTFGAFHMRQFDTDTSSAWQVHASASAVLQQLRAAARVYTAGVSMGQAVRLLGVVRPQAALEAAAHYTYQWFCPVELASGRYHSSLAHHRDWCVECVDETDRRVVVWLANEANAVDFISCPARFFTAEATAQAAALIARAPVDASLLSLLCVADCEFPEMKGYCPVTFQQGTGDKDWHAIVKGSVFYRVSYENKVFFCLSELKRRAFITQPTKYASQVLPIKLPPQLSSSLALKHCPGRIEQELSGVLNETLLLLGAARPKFLGVSITASACMYVALLLKTRASSSVLPDHIRQRYADQRAAFERDCRVSEQLKRLLSPSSATTSCGSGIKGARAVRELSTSSSQGELALPQRQADDAQSAAALCQRFDKLVASSMHATTSSTNQQSRTNQLFLDYAESLLQTTTCDQR